MNADTFRTLAVVFLALAIVLAVVAVVLYRVFDIRAVRDALSGRTATREIAGLRHVRRGQWQHADEFARVGRRGAKRGSASDGSTGTGSTGTTGTHDTSDIEFRPVTGTGSGSYPTNPGETLDAEERHDETRAGAGAKVAPQAASAAAGRHAQGGAARPAAAGAGKTAKSGAKTAAKSAKPAQSAKSGRSVSSVDDGESTVLGSRGNLTVPELDDHFVEIPVAMASAAELADEGETSLMQFRKTDQHATDDDDESRTILVRGGKNK